ncbi:BRO family protein [Chondrinema litorale]|uniref:BRO family protein n=1 Tax=Chondrinema litorale TaxID=2994555 RepID=UPI0025432A5C|nr:BRO family protein [Chondrinema litorale]UZR99178.1 BRO family protein [Chondrinema litorale]
MLDIKLFNSQEIRSVMYKGEPHFLVTDVIAALTETSNANRYWTDLKRREKKASGVELYALCVRLKIEASNGRKYEMECAAKEALFRIIQSVPSKKAEAFKLWLAKVGSDHVDEKLSKRLAAHRKLKESQKRFLENISDRGVDDVGFIKVIEAGDNALFGGKNMHEIYNIDKEENLDDYMNALLLKGKDFATEISNLNVHHKDLQGKEDISKEHEEQNKGIREHLISKTNYKPEDIPPEDKLSQKGLKQQNNKGGKLEE